MAKKKQKKNDDQGKKKKKALMMKRLRDKIKSDPIAHAAYLEKEKERYKKRKQEGKIKTVHDLSVKEQRLRRRKWKKEKRKQRQEKKKSEEADLQNTPPPSPPRPPSPSDDPQPGTSSQKKVGRKKVQRENRQCYRKLAKQEKHIKKLENRIKMLQRKLRKTTGTQALSPKSPASRANALINTANVDAIRKELTFSFSVEEDLKKRLKANALKRKERALVLQSIVGRFTRKYWLLQQAKYKYALSNRQISKKKIEIPKSEIRSNSRKAMSSVREFFVRDDNSTASAGKRETRTLKKDKRQKRYLCDTMTNLFEKFKSEHPKMKISYTSFTRFRPFFVVPPNVHQRDTVKCKTHANVELKAAKLHQVGALKSADLTKLITMAVCSPKTRECMYGCCNTCKDSVSKVFNDDKSTDEQITYAEWTTSLEKRNTTKGEITVNVTKKAEKTTTISDLCKLFKNSFKDLLCHEYRIYHQFQEIRLLKDSLQEHECVLQCDFSENYLGKAATEIQSMHFGASRPQMSLHTSHVTFCDMKTKCFCTVSDDTRHSPAAIWSHLKPVLQEIKASGIKVVHFVSDGPTPQYRNRVNFQLMSYLPFELFGFDHITWNLLEAAHGKGPADGIGAAVKNTADRKIAHGNDIMNAQQLMNAVANINVQMFLVTSSDIDSVARIIDTMPEIPSVKGTMQIHQLLVPKQNTLYHRKLSCYCNANRFCYCYDLKNVQLPARMIVKDNMPKDNVVQAIEESDAENSDDPDYEPNKDESEFDESDDEPLIMNKDESDNEIEKGCNSEKSDESNESDTENSDDPDYVPAGNRMMNQPKKLKTQKSKNKDELFKEQGYDSEFDESDDEPLIKNKVVSDNEQIYDSELDESDDEPLAILAKK